MGTQGNAGIRFDITENEVTTATGEVTQNHAIQANLSELTITSTDLVYSVSGTVGTTSFEFDLNDVNNQSGSDYSTQVVRNNDGDFTSLKQLVIVNTSSANTLTIGATASASLFTWHASNNTLAIDAGQAIAFAYSTAKTISTNGKLTIVGSAVSTTFKIFVLGA